MVKNWTPASALHSDYVRNVILIQDTKTGEPLEIVGSKLAAWRFVHIEGSTYYTKQTKRNKRQQLIDSYSTFSKVLNRNKIVAMSISLAGGKVLNFTLYQFTVKTKTHS